jgi:Tfp pilus assembly protein PilV
MSRSGFTLIEAVVSAVLLALVIAGSYTLLVRSAALIRGARNHYIAMNISKARVERARGFKYDQLSLLTETNMVVNDDGSPLSSGDFRRTTLIDTNYQPGLSLMTVVTEIKDLRTRGFRGENESAAALFTEYLKK